MFVENNLNVFIWLGIKEACGFGGFGNGWFSGCTIKSIFDPSGNEENDGTIGGLNILNGGGNAFTENAVIGGAEDDKDVVFCRETKHEMNE